MKPQIINIVNFVRGAEPRDNTLDLVEPVRNQIEILHRNHLPGTFLLQYDAMMRNDIYDLFQGGENQFEIGLWLELVQPLVEKAGVKWRGRPGFSWDWHVNAGSLIGYKPEERRKIIDVFMCDFRTLFGSYPRSAGAWLIDADSLAYLAEQYGVEAFCNCRDQWGTDGYTLWGGYYGQAYYPSRQNAFIPAQNGMNQIDIPVFRMLGSDPIYQYDAGMDENFNASVWQDVYTLEPTCGQGGGSPSWVRWFFKENFNGHCLSFGYAQAGQENSFGWTAMKNGILDQFGLIAELVSKNKLKAMTLGETGGWYRAQFRQTPCSAIAALSDWRGQNKRSIWFSSRFYRANIFWGDQTLLIRDIHLFREDYSERFLRTQCDGTGCTYDSLPFMDGSQWSGNGTRAGVYPVAEGSDSAFTPETGSKMKMEEKGENLSCEWHLEQGEKIKIECGPNYLEFSRDTPDWKLAFYVDGNADLPRFEIRERALSLIHCRFPYLVTLDAGRFSQSDRPDILFFVKPEGGRVRFLFDSNTQK
ncbi:MAG TPA: hypothetical protein VHO71_02320 [Caproiciproducens sp.]|nr:hypothetical protein [Caproiciproducens sp.]